MTRPVAENDDKIMPIQRVMTKVVGITMGQKVRGQSARQLTVRKLFDENEDAARGVVLHLVREPTNEFDSCAIKVMARVSTGYMPLGYISNGDRSCQNPACEFVWEKRPNGIPPEVCPLCSGEIRRNGLATELAYFMDRGFQYTCTVTAITGVGAVGLNGKARSIGCNIRIDRISGE